MNRSKNLGQATSELVLLIPLFVILAGGMLSICYLCWQGLKVQEAANLAARMQGQERIGGGPTQGQIEDDNGLASGGDIAPDRNSVKDLVPGMAIGKKNAPNGGVYGRIYSTVYKMFSPKEQTTLFVEQPKQGITTDHVRITRVIMPPKIWKGFELKPIMLEATGYGGEDTHMFGLPRWGQVGNQNNKGNASKPFYTTVIKGKD